MNPHYKTLLIVVFIVLSSFIPSDVYSQSHTQLPKEWEEIAQKAKHMGLQQIGKDVLVLSKNFRHFTAYESFLLGIVVTKKDLESSYDPQGNRYFLGIKDVTDEGVGLRFAPLPPALKVLESPSQGFSRFITLNDPKIDVPISVYKGLSDAFLAGLIAKLYSVELFDILVEDRPDSTALQKKMRAEWFFSSKPSEAAALTAFSVAKTYGTTSPKKKVIPQTEWVSNLAKAQMQSDLKTSGLLKGWECGGKILADPEAANLEAATLRLIHHRFSQRQCAKITAFTLTYLEGWAHGLTRLKDKTTPITNPSDIATILESLAPEEEPEQTSQEHLDTLTLADVLCERLGVVRLALSDQARSAPASKREALIKSEIFLEEILQGLREGTSSALPELFVDAYGLGFDVGYQRGLRDGYTQGFSAASASAHANADNPAATQIRTIFNGWKPTFKGVMSAGADIVRVWNGDYKPIEKQVQKAVNWVKKLIGF